jgi:hypothetical protein
MANTNISEHLKNIFSTKALSPGVTVRKIRKVQKEGKRSVLRKIDHYNFDVIIFLGYCVNTQKGIFLVNGQRNQHYYKY